MKNFRHQRQQEFKPQIHTEKDVGVAFPKRFHVMAHLEHQNNCHMGVNKHGYTRLGTRGHLQPTRPP